jgi:hypothetical protein
MRLTDRHKSREVVAMLGLYDQVRHPQLDRVNNDVRQLAVDPINAVDGTTQM